MIKKAKFSGYCFDMNTNIMEDFKICISVPLSLEKNEIEHHIFVAWKIKRPILYSCY